MSNYLKGVRVPTQNCADLLNNRLHTDYVPLKEKLRRCLCVFRGHKWAVNPQRVFYATDEELENTITSRIYCRCCGISLEAAPPIEYEHQQYGPCYAPGFYRIPDEAHTSRQKSGVIKTEK